MLKEYSRSYDLELKELRDGFDYKSKDEMSRIKLAKMVGRRSWIRLLVKCKKMLKQSHDSTCEEGGKKVHKVGLV